MKQARAILTAVLLIATTVWGSAQIVEVHRFNNLNRNVPDGNPSGLSDIRAVSSAVVNLSSVRVRLRVVGEFNGDLYAYLRHENTAGTNWCVLLNRPGRTASYLYGYYDEGLDVILDDTAANGDIHNYQLATNVPAGSALTGIWTPDGRTSDPASVTDTEARVTPLSSFIGLDADGEWTLFVADLHSGATNMLSDWELELAGDPTNPPPVLEPVADQLAHVLMLLVVTNRVADPNQVTPPLTFGLVAGAPNGTWANRTNGVFLWKPSRAQARSTNMISVWMSDSGSPPVTATNTFTIVVDDYCELLPGRTILRAGQTSSVPVTVVTTSGLTNLQALLQAPEDRLTSLALTDLAPAVGSATLQQQTADVWRMEFTASSGQAFQATQELARLSFAAVSNRSAFVSLVSVITTNVQTNGVSIWRTLTGYGHVVVVEREPLLEAFPMTTGLPNLILYGIPGMSYQVESSSALSAGPGWQPEWLGTVPENLWMHVSGLTNTGTTLFFRAVESTAP